MNIQPRSLALVIGFVISTAALGACNDDTSKPVGDVLAQDSSLNLAVLSATGDTATRGTDQSVAMMTTPTTVQSSPAPAQQTAAAPVVSYTDVQSVKVQSSGGSSSRVIAGAGIGAILGRVIGGNAKSTIAGAAVGAAGGAVLANRSVRYDQCVPSGGQIIAHLTQPLRVNVGE